jgi:hypothetical protein
MNALTIKTNEEPDYFPARAARLTILSALLTGLCLGGPLSFPFWYGLGLYYAPASVRMQLVGYLSPDSLRDFWQPGVVVGGVIWGLGLGRLSGVRPLWRLGVAGGLGVFLGEVVVTSATFLRLQQALWPDVPQHIRFAMEFVLGVGLAAGITGLLLGLAVWWGRSAVWLALGMILAAAIPALVVDMGLDAIGIRWGAGNANMAKVVGLAFPAATINAGAFIGWCLAQFGKQH